MTDEHQIDGTTVLEKDSNGNIEAKNLDSLNTDTATINSQDGIGIPTTTTGVSPSFDTWRQVSADRPAIIIGWVQTETDGSTAGIIDLEVDESGGTSADYTVRIARADTALGAGGIANGNVDGIIIPAGAQYQIQNQTDPNNANSIFDWREGAL